MNVASIITEIVQIMYGFLVEGGQAFGTGLSSIVTNMFFVTSGETTSLSAFGVLVFMTFGLSLLVGVTRLVFNIISNFRA